jgi:integrase
MVLSIEYCPFGRKILLSNYYTTCSKRLACTSSPELTSDKWQEHDLVFPSAVGTPIGSDRITHEFPALARKAGMPVNRLHDCRHTAASIMLSLRIPPIIVAGVTLPAAISCGCPVFGRMLGHSLAILLTPFQGPRMKQLDPLAKAAPLVSQQNTLLN